MHIYTLYQGQHPLRIMFEQTYWTIDANGVLQQLKKNTSSQFAHGKEERYLAFLPKQGKQRQKIQRPLCQQGVVLEECILKSGVTGVEQHVKLGLRIATQQSEYYHEQYEIGNNID
jgi:hypothetical protein